MSPHLVQDDLEILPLKAMASRPISWLVPGRFAFGQVAILDGDPDLGKSLIMLDLAARLSTGRSWPDDGSPLEPASTMYLSAEDGDEDTIRPRLEALGADLSRIFVVGCKNASLVRICRLPSQIDFLDRALTQSRARLVVIDPLVAFLDRGILSASDEGIRRALAPLARLAQKHQCVIILIRHLNKKAGSRSMYRGGGSIGLVAQCRSAWLVGLEPQENTNPLLPARAGANPGKRCVLAQIKNNNAPLQLSLLYEIVAHASGYPTIRWLGGCSHCAEDLVAKPVEKTLGPRLRACRFLKDFLADGPRTTEEIWAAAFGEQLYERTLRRARQDARATAQVIWEDGRRLCYWLLPGQKIPASTDSEQARTDDDAFERFLENYRQLAARRTPLDHDEDSENEQAHSRADSACEGKSATPEPVADGAQERKSAERDPDVEGRRERKSAERVPVAERAAARSIERTHDVECAASFAEAAAPDRQFGLNDLEPDAQARVAASPLLARRAQVDAPPPSSSEPPGQKQTASPGPPPPLPEHARWLWHLARPMANAA